MRCRYRWSSRSPEKPKIVTSPPRAEKGGLRQAGALTRVNISDGTRRKTRIARALSTRKRMSFGPPRERSRGPGSKGSAGSDKRSVARASHRRKAPRIAHSLMLLHGSGVTAVLARAMKAQSSERAARHHERATGVSEARSHEATSANNRGPERDDPAEAGDDVVKRRVPRSITSPGLIPRGRQIGREPRARVQVDRLVWVALVGRTYLGAVRHDAVVHRKVGGRGAKRRHIARSKPHNR